MTIEFRGKPMDKSLGDAFIFGDLRRYTPNKEYYIVSSNDITGKGIQVIPSTLGMFSNITTGTFSNSKTKDTKIYMKDVFIFKDFRDSRAVYVCEKGNVTQKTENQVGICEQYCEVIFTCCYFGAKLNKSTKGFIQGEIYALPILMGSMYANDFGDIEIIGNTIDNPELKKYLLSQS